MGVNLSNVQGNILKEFARPDLRLIFFEFGENIDSVAHWLRVIGRQAPDTLSIINSQREERNPKKHDPDYHIRETWLHISLSKQGIEKLGLGVPPSRRVYEGRGRETRWKDASFDPHDPFAEGMKSRAYILGDTGASAPENWVEPYKSAPIDALLIVSSDEQEDIESYSSQLIEEGHSNGVRCVGIEKGMTLKNEHGKAIEHFGFRDGVSQPLIIGIDDEEIEKRTINRDSFYPEDFVLFGLKGDLSWANDGSFLAFRRLRQDVPSFWKLVNEQSKMLGLMPDALAAKFFGRWRSGAPLARHPHSDPNNPKDAEENDFLYRQNTDIDSKGRHPELDDPMGANTPRFSHIRKANPRDDAMSLDQTRNIDVTSQHRILRRPIPYGVPTEQDPGADRGLLFICFQRDLEMQFEFVQTAWLNNADFPIQDLQTQRPHGPDPITGRRDLGNSVNLLRKDNKFVPIRLKRWVTTTGGGYFFSPSISALRNMKSTSS